MSKPRFGSQTLASVGLSLLVIAGAFLAIRPRFSEGRLRLDNKHLLTPVEVQAIPDGVLPVVLGRDLGDTEREFKTQLLRLIMERSGVDFAFGLTAEDLSQDAAVDALASGQLVGDKNPHAITIGVYGAGRALNSRLRVIPIPITGGVLGLRVGWTHDMRLSRLASVDHLNDLRALTLLQGHGWSELDIFDAAGLKTFESAGDDLFRLVDQQRVDLLLRGVAEIEGEQSVVSRFSDQLVLDPYLLVAYPFAGFFYVSPGNKELADAVTAGFEEIMRDGSYQQLLESQLYTSWLRDRLKLKQRRVIFIPNPEARGVLDEVYPQDWIVPWGLLADGTIQTGEQLCAIPGLAALCN